MLTPYMQARKNRILMAKKILESYGELEIHKAKAVISFNLGVSIVKAEEYLQILANLGSIEFRDNKVIVVKKEAKE